jgi:hypothetical protein
MGRHRTSVWARLSRGLLVGLVACQPEAADPVSEVRSVLDRVVAAVEDRAAGPILSHVAFEIQTQDGLRYADVQSIVMEYLLPERTLGARLESAEIEPGPEPGEIRVNARIRFAKGTRLRNRDLPPPPDSRVYAFEVWFRRIEGHWQALRGSYRRVEAP